MILKEPDTKGTYQGRQTSAQERGWATAAAITCVVQQEAVLFRLGLRPTGQPGQAKMISAYGLALVFTRPALGRGLVPDLIGDSMTLVTLISFYNFFLHCG